VPPVGSPCFYLQSLVQSASSPSRTGVPSVPKLLGVGIGMPSGSPSDLASMSALALVVMMNLPLMPIGRGHQIYGRPKVGF